MRLKAAENSNGPLPYEIINATQQEISPLRGKPFQLNKEHADRLRKKKDHIYMT